MSAEIVIAGRYCGPPDIGNGGYVCGALAGALGASAAEATLRAPAPLDRPLRLVREDDAAALYDGEREIARARPAALALDPPAPPSFDDAIEASMAYAGFKGQTFARCFVCGPDRDEDDGLRIFAGPVPERGLHAAPWIAHHALTEGDTTRLVWAALDCPGYFAFAAPGLVCLLGSMSARIDRPPEDGEACVIVAWPLGEDGRKRHAGTAMYGEDGALLAVARQTWIAIATG